MKTYTYAIRTAGKDKPYNIVTINSTVPAFITKKEAEQEMNSFISKKIHLGLEGIIVDVTSIIDEGISYKGKIVIAKK